MQATAQCGVPLEVLENALREKGYTTGHSPQSKPLAQMGGLVATRSIGQFFHTLRRNRGYGRWSGSGAGRWHRHTH